jgi:Aldo/keto reductase family.
MERAVEQGVNFVDTADLYGTYPYIREIIKKYPDLVVSSKSYAYDVKTAKETLERCLKGISRDYVDFFLLHEQEGPLTIKGHWEALEFFLKCKEKGIIRGVGLSTHYVAAVKAAAKIKEIDVIHPIINYRGFGIVDGTLNDMEVAVRDAYNEGKGIYAMKPLGGGHLISDFQRAFEYILRFPYVHSIAVGMQRVEEVEANIKIFENEPLSNELVDKLRGYKRQLFIQDWCQGCGECVKRCGQGALKLNDEGKTEVDSQKCILCGYCGSACKELAIKIL